MWIHRVFLLAQYEAIKHFISVRLLRVSNEYCETPPHRDKNHEVFINSQI